MWGPRALRPWRWSRQRRSYRRLEPLWRTLSEAVPQVRLADGDDAGDIGLRLYRRVIEIRDAQLLLEPFADADAVARAEEAARARGLAGEPLQAYVEATALATALPRWDPDRPAAASTASPRKTAGDATLSRETRFLERVAAAFAEITPAVEYV